jgi:hypothetical protein
MLKAVRDGDRQTLLQFQAWEGRSTSVDVVGLECLDGRYSLAVLLCPAQLEEPYALLLQRLVEGRDRAVEAGFWAASSEDWSIGRAVVWRFASRSRAWWRRLARHGPARRVIKLPSATRTGRKGRCFAPADRVTRHRTISGLSVATRSRREDIGAGLYSP